MARRPCILATWAGRGGWGLTISACAIISATIIQVCDPRNEEEEVLIPFSSYFFSPLPPATQQLPASIQGTRVRSCLRRQ